MTQKELFMTRFGPHDESSVKDIMNSHDEEKIYALAENPFVQSKHLDPHLDGPYVHALKNSPSLDSDAHLKLFKSGKFPSYNDHTKKSYIKHADVINDYLKRTHIQHTAAVMDNVIDDDDFPLSKENIEKYTVPMSPLGRRKSIPQEIKDKLFHASWTDKLNLASHTTNQEHLEHLFQMSMNPMTNYTIRANAMHGILSNPHVSDEMVRKIVMNKEDLIQYPKHEAKLKEVMKQRGISE